MSAEHVLSMMNEHEVKFVDLRFTDTKGKEQHVTIPAHQKLTLTSSKKAKCSMALPSAAGKSINESDMVLMPDATTAVMDPFFEDSTLIIRCDILEPGTMQGYDRDPRSIAKRALKTICVLQASLIPFCLDPSQNSSCSTISVSVRQPLVHTSLSMISKRPGTPAKNTKAVTKVTVQV